MASFEQFQLHLLHDYGLNVITNGFYDGWSSDFIRFKDQKPKTAQKLEEKVRNPVIVSIGKQNANNGILTKLRNYTTVL